MVGIAYGRFYEYDEWKEVTAYDWWYASLYINLGKYNEEELVGDWFSFPLDEEVIAEHIGLNAE